MSSMVITIRKDDLSEAEATEIFEFLKENAAPYPGMKLYMRMIDNNPPYVVPEEPPT